MERGFGGELREMLEDFKRVLRKVRKEEDPERDWRMESD